MKSNKINMILVLVCIFLFVCVVCIKIIIPKRIIQLSNNEGFYNYGDYRYEHNYEEEPAYIINEDVYTYGDVFYATIERIERHDNTNYNDTGYNGKRHGTMYIQGLDINDINHRGERNFSIDDDIKYYWNHKEINLSDLREGQTIAVTSIGCIDEGGVGYLTKVARVVVLDDKL